MAKERFPLTLKDGDRIEDDNVFFYRHVFEQHVTAHGVTEASLQPNLSVDINTLTTPRLSRIIWGLLKGGDPKKFKTERDRPYKEPSRFKLYALTMAELKSIEALMERVVCRPLNLNGPLKIGAPRNGAHCEIEYDYENVMIRQKVAGMLKPYKECPDVNRELRTLRFCVERKVDQGLAA